MYMHVYIITCTTVYINGKPSVHCLLVAVEEARIYRAGGWVEFNRVNGELRDTCTCTLLCTTIASTSLFVLACTCTCICVYGQPEQKIQIQCTCTMYVYNMYMYMYM